MSEWKGQSRERVDRASARACVATLESAALRLLGQRAGGPLCFGTMRVMKDTLVEAMAKLEGKEFEPIPGDFAFYSGCRPEDCSRRGFAAINGDGSRAVLGMVGCAPRDVKASATTLYVYADYDDYALVPSTVRDRIEAWRRDVALTGARYEMKFLGRKLGQ